MCNPGDDRSPMAELWPHSGDLSGWRGVDRRGNVTSQRCGRQTFPAKVTHRSNHTSSHPHSTTGRGPLTPIPTLLEITTTYPRLYDKMNTSSYKNAINRVRRQHDDYEITWLYVRACVHACVCVRACVCASHNARVRTLPPPPPPPLSPPPTHTLTHIKYVRFVDKLKIISKESRNSIQQDFILKKIKIHDTRFCTYLLVLLLLCPDAAE